MALALIYSLTDGQGAAIQLLNPIIVAAGTVPATNNLQLLVNQIAADVSGGGGGTPADLTRYNTAQATLNGSGPESDFATSSQEILDASNDLDLEAAALRNLCDGTLPPDDVVDTLSACAVAIGNVNNNLATSTGDAVAGAAFVATGDLTADQTNLEGFAQTALSDHQAAYTLYFPAAPPLTDITDIAANELLEFPNTISDLSDAIQFLEPAQTPTPDIRDDSFLVRLFALRYAVGNGGSIPGLRQIVATKAGVSPNWPAYTGIDPATDDILDILEYLNVSVN